jgi:hypothetical protein
MKTVRTLFLLGIIAVFAASCTTMTRSMKTPGNVVRFEKADFEFSGQVSGEATQTKIFGIDFARLFSKKYGDVQSLFQVSIPVIGNFTGSVVNMYALYNLMNDNPGYDVVFYPAFEAKTTGLPLLFTTTNVKVQARLAKIE